MSKMGNFWEKKPLTKNPQLLLLKNKKVLTGIYKDVKKMVDNGNRTAPPPDSEPRWHSTYVLYETPTLQTWTLRVIGKFRRRNKNADYWIEDFPFEKKNRRKKTIYLTVNVKNKIAIIQFYKISLFGNFFCVLMKFKLTYLKL